jgi:hypothetical protein
MGIAAVGRKDGVKLEAQNSTTYATFRTCYTGPLHLYSISSVSTWVILGMTKRFRFCFWKLFHVNSHGNLTFFGYGFFSDDGFNCSRVSFVTHFDTLYMPGQKTSLPPGRINFSVPMNRSQHLKTAKNNFFYTDNVQLVTLLLLFFFFHSNRNWKLVSR